MSSNKDGVGVVIGRFQTPWLHEGHFKVLDAANSHNHMIVFLGIHGIPGSYGQELDYATRVLMIKEKYPQAITLPLKNCPTDLKWSQQLDKKITEIFPFSKVTFYHGRNSFAPHYCGRFKKMVDVGGEKYPNATSCREKSYKQVINSDHFRQGVFYGSYNRFPTVSPTVDIAITRKNRTEILLGKKNDGRGWRFPGGFVDIEDNCAEQAAIREANEETGLFLESPNYISSRKVNDWRNTSRNTVMTFFYHFDYQMGHAAANDDLAKIDWHNIEAFVQEQLVPEHQHLYKDLLTFLGRNK